MTHAVNKALTVKRLAVYDFGKIRADLFAVGLVRDMLSDVLHHLHDLDIGAAVLWALQ